MMGDGVPAKSKQSYVPAIPIYVEDPSRHIFDISRSRQKTPKDQRFYERCMTHATRWQKWHYAKNTPSDGIKETTYRRHKFLVSFPLLLRFFLTGWGHTTKSQQITYTTTPENA
jgi:hypothetical protein